MHPSRKYYDSKAESYEEEHDTPYFRHLFRVEEKLVGELERPLLDIGAGMRDVGGMAVDVSYTMLSRNPSRLRVLGDALSLPFPDETFSSVVCLSMTANLIPFEELVKEVRRVLKPGGKFLLSYETSERRKHIKRHGLSITILESHPELEGFRLIKRHELFKFFKPSWRYKGISTWKALLLRMEKFLPGKGHVEVVLAEKV